MSRARSRSLARELKHGDAYTFEPLRDEDTPDFDDTEDLTTWSDDDAQDMPPQTIRSRMQPGAPGAGGQPADPT